MTHTPHDALVHAIFGQPQFAAEELRAVLLPEVLAELDLATLAPMVGTFIDEELRTSSADLLFSVGLRKGGAGLVYVLFEHQSTLDERMPLRLLRYQTRIWERFAAEHPFERKVPPIVPLLLHQGPRPWPWPPSFSSVVALDERRRAAFRGHLIAFDFFLDDLARQSDDQIMKRGVDAIVRLTLLALRNGRSHPKLFELMAAAMHALREELRGPAVVPAIGRLSRYAYELDESPSPPAVIRTAFEAVLFADPGSDSMVTAADAMRIELLREVLLRQVEARFGAAPPAIRLKIERASLNELKEWSIRFASAVTIEEVFAD